MCVLLINKNPLMHDLMALAFETFGADIQNIACPQLAKRILEDAFLVPDIVICGLGITEAERLEIIRTMQQPTLRCVPLIIVAE